MTLVGIQQNQVIAQLTALPTLVLVVDILIRFTRRPDEAPLQPR